MVTRGLFIVFEGCDRCGKTTQSQLIVKDLANAEYMKFPDRTTDIGRIINDYLTGKLKLSDQQIHFLFALNRKELVTYIEEKLKEGKTLIVDRYSYSGIAYSSVKEGMDLKFCCLTEVGLPRPDLVLFLHGSMEVQMKRANFGEEVYEKIEIQRSVEEAYMKLFRSQMKLVESDGDIGSVHDLVMKCINTNLPSLASTTLPIQYFSMQDLNIPEESGKMKDFVDDTMNKSMLIIELAKAQETLEKEVSLNTLTDLLRTVKC